MYLPAPADDSSAGFLIFDADHRSVWANETLARFFGLPRHELLGLERRHFPLRHETPEKSCGPHESAAVRDVAGGCEADIYLPPTGRRAERWLSVRTLPIQSGPFAGGHIQHWVDITEGRRLRSHIEGAKEGEGFPCRFGGVGEAPRLYAVGSDRSRLRRAGTLSSASVLPGAVSCGGSSLDPSPSSLSLDPAASSPASDRTADPCRAFLDHIDLAVLVIDSSHRIVLANAAAGRLVGLPFRTLVGRRCHSVLPLKHTLCSDCPGMRALASGGSVSVSMEYFVREETRVLHLKAYPLPEGRFALLLEDITERKRGEDHLREAFAEAGRSRDWIDSILRSVADGLIVADENGRVMLMNGAAEKLLGVCQPPLFQAQLEDCIGERRLLKRFRDAVEGKEDGTRFEYEAAGPGGTRVLTVGISQVRDAGERRGTVFLLQDVTHQRELDRMKNEFISTAAHELRTPLTSILGFSELLLTRDDLPLEQQNDFLTFIHQKAENLSRIISDLLDVSRIEAGRGLELNREHCRIDLLLRETVEPYRKCSVRHSLEVALPSAETVLNIDRGKIIQVLENLLSNAFKYSPRGGLVRVSASLARGAYLISVEDQGIGMSREQLSRAFDKFYRGDSSNAAVEGTGLGLAITKYIVEAHGGRIWLESRRGKGTTASFTLPLLPDPGHSREPLSTEIRVEN